MVDYTGYNNRTPSNRSNRSIPVSTPTPALKSQSQSQYDSDYDGYGRDYDSYEQRTTPKRTENYTDNTYANVKTNARTNAKTNVRANADAYTDAYAYANPKSSAATNSKSRTSNSPNRNTRPAATTKRENKILNLDHPNLTHISKVHITHTPSGRKLHGFFVRSVNGTTLFDFQKEQNLDSVTIRFILKQLVSVLNYLFQNSVHLIGLSLHNMIISRYNQSNKAFLTLVNFEAVEPFERDSAFETYRTLIKTTAAGFTDPRYAQQIDAFINVVSQARNMRTIAESNFVDLSHVQKDADFDQDMSRHAKQFAYRGDVYRIVSYLTARLASHEQLAHLISIFHNIDRNNDGWISRKELEQAIDIFKPLVLGTGQLDADAITLFKQLDYNRDGFISWKEFLTSYIKENPDARNNKIHQNLLRLIFEDLDFDRSGTVSFAELSAGIIRWRSLFNPVVDNDAELEADRMVHEMDTNQDGFVSYNEFRSYIQARSASHRQKLEFIFRFMDVNEQSKLSCKHVSTVLMIFSKLFGSLTDAPAATASEHEISRKLLERFDLNQDGGVDLNEFRAMYGRTGRLSNDQLAAIFRECDSNRDKRLDRNELLKALCVCRVLDLADLNNDGKISYMEFMAAFLPLGDDIDMNHITSQSIHPSRPLQRLFQQLMNRYQEPIKNYLKQNGNGRLKELIDYLLNLENADEYYDVKSDGYRSNFIQEQQQQQQQRGDSRDSGARANSRNPRDTRDPRDTREKAGRRADLSRSRDRDQDQQCGPDLKICFTGALSRDLCDYYEIITEEAFNREWDYCGTTCDWDQTGSCVFLRNVPAGLDSVLLCPRERSGRSGRSGRSAQEDCYVVKIRKQLAIPTQLDRDLSYKVYFLNSEANTNTANTNVTTTTTPRSKSRSRF